MALKALILVDFENEWIATDSPYFLGDLSTLIAKTNQLIDYCRKQKMKIIFIRHVEKESKEVFVENSLKTEIITLLHRERNDVVITKYKVSPFYQTSLGQELEGIREIVVSGILTNLCVRSLVQDAYDREFSITIIEDCCIAMEPKTHTFTLKDLKMTREELVIVHLTNFISS